MLAQQSAYGFDADQRTLLEVAGTERGFHITANGFPFDCSDT